MSASRLATGQKSVPDCLDLKLASKSKLSPQAGEAISQISDNREEQKFGGGGAPQEKIGGAGKSDMAGAGAGGLSKSISVVELL